MSWARQAERGLLGFFVLALIWAPVPLASNRGWGVAILAAWVGLLLSGTLALQAWTVCRQRRLSLHAARADHRRGRHDIVDLVDLNPPGSTRGAWVVAGLLALFGLWASLPLLGVGETADAFVTRQYVLRCATYTAAFVVVQRLVNTPRRRLFLMSGLLAAGVLQALLAVVLFSAGGQYEIFGHPTGGSTRASGTFANPDHLAQFMVLTLSAGIGIMLAQMGGDAARPRNGRERLLALMRFVMSPKMLVRLLLVVLVITLVLTRSRAGNGAFFIALFLLCGWVMWTSPRLRLPAGLLVVSLLVVDLVVIGQWVGLDQVVQRLQATELAQQAEAAASGTPGAPPPRREETMEERLRAAEDALQLVRLKPWTGWGGGTFHINFPAVKQQALPLRYDHVHNDYVEIAADTGLTGLALLALAVGLTVWRVARLMSDRTGPLDRGIAAGVGMALFCALLHATVDFNLQVTTNALVLTVLLAVAWSVPVPARADRVKSR
ncbi:O-antigen ligase-like membrane protein [Sphaerotilus hippei]|uniref:O-antigen ligase-like membrane protein n=1 Tax=Sphaerotilus hippei TaxID=744406 RepID=A0A318H6L4_9BURK|nr:O-antigen ligase-like membrane protein [Sphaerotilus hippei]